MTRINNNQEQYKYTACKKLFGIICTVLSVSGFSQQTIPPANISGTENYVYTREYLAETSVSSNSVPQVQSVTYFDGLGRQKQNIAIKASPLGKDIVTRVEYDALGRQIMDFLPMPQQGTTNGGIYSSTTMAYTEQVGSPLYGGTGPFFSKKEIEYSPLSRPLSSMAPGDWNAKNKKVTIDYQLNAASEVKNYGTVTSWSNGVTSSVLTVSGSYGAKQLYKNIATDEDNNVSIEFKDKLGHTVLVRKMLNGSPVDTYYVYNEYQDLAFVLSPLFSDKNKNATTALLTTAADLDNLCYQYQYDSKGRLAQKKLPGKGWEYMVYDKQDRPVLTQDEMMRPDKRWLFTKYDKFGRILYTGTTTDPGTREGIQAYIDYNFPLNAEGAGSFTQNGLTVEYSNSGAFPTYIEKLLSVNYYDTYPTGTIFPTGNKIQGVDIITATINSSTGNVTTKSLPTASFVKNLEDDKWTKAYTFYDQKARPIGVWSYNHLGGYTKNESVLDFAGVPQKTMTYHKRLSSSTETVIKEDFVYDHQNRLLEHYHEVVGKSPVVSLAKNTYNEIGQLTKKEVGRSAANPLQTIDYKYNIRGWLTDVNDPATAASMETDLFAYTIRYNDRIGLPTPSTAYPNLIVQPKYNGNIAEIDWNAVESTGATPYSTPMRYGYVYDDLNRLLAGFYQDPTNRSKGTNNEIIEEYDLNGNIKKLKRFAYKPKSTVPALIDNLTYTYTGGGNRVTNIADASNNMNGYEGGNGLIEYDANGNMTKMPDKGISNIVYNHLNLPKEIVQVNNTKYFYRADGVKIKKAFTLNNSAGSTLTDSEYLDGFQYVTRSAEIVQAFKSTDDTTLSAKTAGQEETFVSRIDEANAVPQPQTTMVLSFFPTAEGFYDVENSRYIYQYKDHLGNVRVSYYKDDNTNTLEVADRNDFYPFGMNFVGYYSVFDAQGSLFNYKYNGKELQETGMYDYGARFYMPDIGRFGQYDPLAEKTMEPYGYVYNNPVRMTDPTGMEGEDSSGGDSGSGGETGGGNEGGGCCNGGDKIEGAKFDGRNYDGGIKSFSVSKDGTQNTEIEGVTVNGNKSSSDWAPSSGSFSLGGGGGGGGSKKGPSLSSVLFGISSQSDWNRYNTNSSAFHNMTKVTGADKIEIQFYMMFGGMLAAPFAASAYTALGAYGTAGTYAQGAIVRGSLDFSTQVLFKGTGNVDYRQLGINTFVGGGNGYQNMVKVAAGNLILNTANNFGTSAFQNKGIDHIPVNTAKTITGALGGAFGIIGGDIVGSVYGNGMDAYLQNANDNYKK